MKTIVEEKKSYWLACFTNDLSNMRKMACFVELIYSSGIEINIFLRKKIFKKIRNRKIGVVKIVFLIFSFICFFIFIFGLFLLIFYFFISYFVDFLFLFHFLLFSHF